MKAAASLTALTALGAGGVLASASAAHAVGDGLRIVDRNESDARMRYYRFATSAIGWNPGVNVLLPDGYHASGRRYPVLHLFHGGGTDQDFVAFDRMRIRAWTAGKPLIVVMPDGGHAGWYSNPVSSSVGPRDWETFHIAQLLPWVDANFRTYAEYDGRAVSGQETGNAVASPYGGFIVPGSTVADLHLTVSQWYDNRNYRVNGVAG